MKLRYVLGEARSFYVIQSDCSVVCGACLRPEDRIIEPADRGLTCDRCGVIGMEPA